MNPVPVIRLDGLVLYTHHGVAEAEREIGQRMVFDLELIPETCGATASDEVAETIDYGRVTELVAALATGARYRTLERLVTVVAQTLLERFPAATVKVRATKPVPPVPFTMDGASVEIVMQREDLE